MGRGGAAACAGGINGGGREAGLTVFSCDWAGGVGSAAGGLRAGGHVRGGAIGGGAPSGGRAGDRSFGGPGGPGSSDGWLAPFVVEALEKGAVESGGGAEVGLAEGGGPGVRGKGVGWGAGVEAVWAADEEGAEPLLGVGGGGAGRVALELFCACVTEFI